MARSRARERELARRSKMRSDRYAERNKDVMRVLTSEPMAEGDIAKAVTWGSNRSLLTKTLGWLCENGLVEEVDGDGPRRFKLGPLLNRAR